MSHNGLKMSENLTMREVKGDRRDEPIVIRKKKGDGHEQPPHRRSKLTSYIPFGMLTDSECPIMLSWRRVPVSLEELNLEQVEDGACNAVLARIYRDLLKDRKKRHMEAILFLNKFIRTNYEVSIHTIVESRVLQRCVWFIQHVKRNLFLQSTAACVLHAVAEGGLLGAQAVVYEGAVGALADLLQSYSITSVEAAVMTLGNIAAYGLTLGSDRMNNYIITNLLVLAEPSTPVELLRHVAWTLATICDSYGKNFSQQSTKLCILGAIKLVNITDDVKVVSEGCMAMNYLTFASQETLDHLVEQVIQSGTVPRLIQLLNKRIQRFYTPCLDIMINFVTSSKRRTQYLIDAGLLPTLVYYLKSGDDDIVWCAAWAVRNIAVPSNSQALALVRAGMVPLLDNVLNKGRPDAQEKAMDALRCIALERDRHANHLYNDKIIPELCNMFTCKDSKAVLTSLQTVDEVLKTTTRFGNIGKVPPGFEKRDGIDGESWR